MKPLFNPLLVSNSTISLFLPEILYSKENGKEEYEYPGKRKLSKKKEQTQICHGQEDAGLLVGIFAFLYI